MSPLDELRPVSVEGIAPFPLADQPAPQLMWVKVADLVIDDRYQRPLNTSNWTAIKRIARDFRWSRFSPVMVAPVEGGRYAVIDGQHRAHAAALCGIRSIPAMVALVAPQEQALAFVEINTQQIRVSPHVVYRAALTAGEPWALACCEAVAAAGCHLMTRNNVSKNEKKPGQIYCIGLIRNLVNAGHGQAVTDGLSTLREYDSEATANYSDAFLAPWLGACAEHPGKREAYLNVLMARRPWLVISSADKLAEEDGRPKLACRREFFSMMMRHEGGDK
ncbi:ParB/RepB/Spo0J family partition protein [Paracoccus laeviglucosivorans]|uniref:ParB-like nuclease domain-containing protein n=1 Tax=Paracoccus laeviglucosivorans TaxID=1197861 RepID=A0A521E647_9RHOB|nr:ParB/RepB/Spo0J family partition protein [Paracoccus laeviglucosivorans]SMO79416.1 ParB-like nuclease domain-containing protein [Paracoccus laeviglucosivorans]